MRALAALLALGIAATAHAETVYRTVVGQGDVVEFYSEKAEGAPCGPDGLRALWTVNAGPRKGEQVPGCYLIRDGTVYMLFADGDRYAVPLSVIEELHRKGGA